MAAKINLQGTTSSTFEVGAAAASKLILDASAATSNATLSVTAGGALQFDGSSVSILPADPGADSLLFWDNTGNNIEWTQAIADSFLSSNVALENVANTFTQTQTIDALHSLHLTNTSGPLIRLTDGDATAGARNFRIRGVNTQLLISTENDAQTLVENAIAITANGSSEVTLVALAGDEVDLTATTLDFNGNADISGTLAIGGGSSIASSSILARTNAANTFTDGQTIQKSGIPYLRLDQNDAAADNQNWLIYAQSEQFRIAAESDAGSLTPFLIVDRTGTTVDEIQLDATTFDFNGNIDFDGTTYDIDAATTLTLHGGSADITLSGTTAQIAATTLDFNGDADISGTLQVNDVTAIVAAEPRLRWDESDQSTDNRNWLARVNGAEWSLGTAAGATPTTLASKAIAVTRSGTSVSEVELNATTLDFNGNADISGTLTVGSAGANSAVLRLVGNDATGDNYISFFEDDGSTRKGYLGYGNVGDDVFYIANEENANVLIQTNASTRLTIGTSALTITNLTNMAVPSGFSFITGGGTLTFSGTGETLATFVDDGACTLYYDNVARLATVSGGVSVTGSLDLDTTLRVTNIDPTIYLIESDAAANNKEWLINANGEQFKLYAVNDAHSVFTSFMTVDRTGTTVDEIQLDATTLDFNGTADISGSLAWGGGSAIASSNNVVSTSAANTFTNSQTISTTGPVLRFIETDAAANNQAWDFFINAEQFNARVINDALSSAVNWLVVDRTANTVDQIQLNATTLDVNGNADISGTLVVGSSATINNNIISRNNNVALSLRDSGGSASDMTSYVSLQDSANTERGWMGFGSGTTLLSITNSIGNINLAGSAVTINSNTAWHAGNDGAGSGLDADLLDGLNAVEAATGNTIVRRHASGYIFATYYNQSSGNNENPTISQFMVQNGSDDYNRKASLDHVGTTLGIRNNQTTASFTYGGYHLHTASRNSYYGLVLNDGAHIPTFMSNGTTLGIYMQGTAGNWMIYYTHGSGTVTTPYDFTANSDIRLKTDIEVIPNALEKVKTLSGYTYTKGSPGGDILGRRTGVIAQEVEKVLPEAVNDGDDGYKTVAYGNMVGLLIEAIKELEAQVAELRAAR